MKDGKCVITAIIAEYNPFHNGHLYQLKEARKKTGADFVVIIMSGDHVQRGEPSVTDMYDRARAACLNGADAVFLMPFTASVSSVADFAAGGVDSANALGIVDYLVFGAEDDDTEELTKAAKSLISIENDSEMNEAIQNLSAEGRTYPEALSKVLTDKGMSDVAELISKPNNTLGINYIMSLIRSGSDIKPVAVKRIGAGHFDGPDKKTATESATSIRKALRSGNTGEILDSVPAETAENFAAYQNGFITANDYSSILFYRLAMISKEAGNKAGFVKMLSSYADVSPALASRIYAKFKGCAAWDELAASIWSKNLTYGRIDRALIHILFGITDESIKEKREKGFCSYIRPLAIKRSSLDLLRLIKDYGKAPIISRISDEKLLKKKAACDDFNMSLLAADIYKRTYQNFHSHECYDEYGPEFMQIL